MTLRFTDCREASAAGMAAVSRRVFLTWVVQRHCISKYTLSSARIVDWRLRSTRVVGSYGHFWKVGISASTWSLMCIVGYKVTFGFRSFVL